MIQPTVQNPKREKQQIVTFKKLEPSDIFLNFSSNLLINELT